MSLAFLFSLGSHIWIGGFYWPVAGNYFRCSCVGVKGDTFACVMFWKGNFNFFLGEVIDESFFGAAMCCNQCIFLLLALHSVRNQANIWEEVNAKSTWNLSSWATADGLLTNTTAKKLLLRKDRKIVCYTLKSRMKKGLRKVSSSYYIVWQSEYFPDQKTEDLWIY